MIRKTPTFIAVAARWTDDNSFFNGRLSAEKQAVVLFDAERGWEPDVITGKYIMAIGDTTFLVNTTEGGGLACSSTVEGCIYAVVGKGIWNWASDQLMALHQAEFQRTSEGVLAFGMFGMSSPQPTVGLFTATGLKWKHELGYSDVGACRRPLTPGECKAATCTGLSHTECMRAVGCPL